MTKGTQIVYVPRHTNGNMFHPDSEKGFVMKLDGRGNAWCGYWAKGRPSDVLRTISCSELTPMNLLVQHVSRNPCYIKTAIKKIEAEQSREFSD